MLRRARSASALALLAVMPLASCGDSASSGSATSGSAGVPRTVGGSVPAAPLTPGAEGSDPVVPPGSGGAPEAPRSVYGSVPAPQAPSDGASGDAAGAPRAQVIFTVSDGRLTPRALTLPAGSAAELVLVSDDGEQHTATLRAASASYAVTARPGAPGSVALPALRPGEYRLELGASRASLIVHGAP